MNPKSHRLIFNPSRGCVMAVAETSRSCGKSGASGTTRNRRSTRTKRKSCPRAKFQASNRHLAQSPIVQTAINSVAKVANKQIWLSSDYMLSRLTVDPDITQKRMGDGFYEQRLINEQIAVMSACPRHLPHQFQPRFLRSLTTCCAAKRASRDFFTTGLPNI